ncbi:MAG: hypothetical protein V3U75_13770 [Methylococcaceae bacterium]
MKKRVIRLTRSLVMGVSVFATFGAAACVDDMDRDESFIEDEVCVDESNIRQPAQARSANRPRDFARQLLHGSREDVPTGAVIANGSHYVIQTRTSDKDIIFNLSIKDGRQQLRVSRHDLVTGREIAVSSGSCNGIAGDQFNFTHGANVTAGTGGDKHIYIVGHARCPLNSDFKIGDDRGGHRHLDTEAAGTGILVQLNPDLTVGWAENQRSGDETKAESVATSKDFVYAAGHFKGGELRLQENGRDPVMNKLGSRFDVFLVQYNLAHGSVPGGTSTFRMIGVGGSEDDGQPEVATDTQGNVILAGYYRSPDAKVYNERGEVLASLPEPSGVTDKNEVASNVFVVKLTPDFRVMWVRTFGGTGDDKARALAAKWPYVYVGGYFEASMRAGGFLRNQGGRDGFLVRLDTRSGTIQYGVQIGGVGTDSVTSVGVSSTTNRVFAGGFYERSMRVGHTTLNSAGGRDPFLIDFDQSIMKSPIVRAAGRGSENDEGKVLAVRDGRVRVAGVSESTDFRVGKVAVPKTGSKQDSYLIGLTDRRGLLPLRLLNVETPSIIDLYYTTDESQRNIATDSAGFTDAFVLGYVWPTPSTSTYPLHRYYNPTTHDHFMTTQQSLVDKLKQNPIGYSYEGIIGYVAKNNFRGAVPLYQVWCPWPGARRAHHYPIKLSQVNNLVQQGCIHEGLGANRTQPIGWLSPALPQPL